MPENPTPLTALIVGGYGTVGTVVCKLLAAKSNVRVIVGGRDAVKAASLASEIAGEGRVIDLASGSSIERALDGIDVALNCFSGPFTGFDLELPEACIRRGVHYLDVAGSNEYSERLLKLSPKAEAAGVTLITGFGANPGMSSVVMMTNGTRFDRIERGEVLFAMGSDIKGISVGGLRELKYMFAQQPLIWEGEWRKPRTPSKSLFLGPPFNRKIYFGAAITRDLISLPKLMPIERLEAWSGLQGMLQAMALLIGFKFGWADDDRRAARFLRLVRRLGKFKGSTEDLLIRISAEGLKDGAPRRRVIEIISDENYATAVSPVIAIWQFAEGKVVRRGAFTAPEVLDPEDFLVKLPSFNLKCLENLS